jgi:hypothetical protein
MSLKIGTSVEFHLSMICKQTTHRLHKKALSAQSRPRD